MIDQWNFPTLNYWFISFAFTTCLSYTGCTKYWALDIFYTLKDQFYSMDEFQAFFSENIMTCDIQTIYNIEHNSNSKQDESRYSF